MLERGDVISATPPAAQVELLVWSGPCGGQPEVRPMSRGDDGVWAAQVPLSAQLPRLQPGARNGPEALAKPHVSKNQIFDSLWFNGGRTPEMALRHPPTCTVVSRPRFLQLRNSEAAPAPLHNHRPM